MITIGTVARPIGIKGEIRVLPLTDSADRFSRLTQVNLSDGAARLMQVDVEGVRYNRGAVILKLRGIDTRWDAERLRGLFVVVQPDDAPPLPEGRYYIHDIIGLNVVTEDGTPLGSVRDVMLLASNDVYVVQGERGEILIPAIRDVVKTIDIAGRTMIIHPLEGLLD